VVVRGDMSLGPIQAPDHSSLLAAGVKCLLEAVTILAENEFQVSARLTFLSPPAAAPPFQFSYGSGGYDYVELKEPDDAAGFGDDGEDMAED
jgi:hypothetical protein